jgi:hypothetical protein
MRQAFTPPAPTRALDAWAMMTALHRHARITQSVAPSRSTMTPSPHAEHV